MRLQFMEDLECDECGYEVEFVGDVKNTRSYKCPECFTEKVEFIIKDICKHEYDDRNYNKCIHCGKESIHLK